MNKKFDHNFNAPQVHLKFMSLTLRLLDFGKLVNKHFFFEKKKSCW